VGQKSPARVAETHHLVAFWDANFIQKNTASSSDLGEVLTFGQMLQPRTDDRRGSMEWFGRLSFGLAATLCELLAVIGPAASADLGPSHVNR
jgi:hypothetical protein